MPFLDKRGNGFVHLNTPASISYTPGQALTLTELTRKRDRVECVTLPASMVTWRGAFQAYASSEGFQAMAADVEDERSNEEVILPPLAKKSATVSTHSSFCLVHFIARASDILTQTAEGQQGNCSSTPSVDQGPLKTEPDYQGRTVIPRWAPHHGKLSTSHKTDRISDSPGGIHIVSHHKVIGKSEFTYIDHDGILSSGVVPEVVITPEEIAQKEADKKYYISPHQMTIDEFNAFEELQSLWKSKARSHSAQGAMHRAAEEGSVVAPTTANDDVIDMKKKPYGDMKKNVRVGGSYYQPTFPLSSHADRDIIEEKESLPDGAATEEVLSDALRMVDDLLRFV